MKSIVDSISDLSLLEFSGEDDSLLADTSAAANLFHCSPLVSLRSKPRHIKGRENDSVDSEDMNSSTNDSVNKENAKCSKPEALDNVGTLSQQKKRKKKLGGFNLRKSLAWDRAFFTEQGVLNPLELSMISGTVTPNSKSNLEAINEEEPATTSFALQEIEGNLFMHSSGGVSIRDRKIAAVSGLSPKPGSSIKQTPPASLAKRKILAVNDVGNRYKRSACPRPAVSSSSTDTVKTPSKESKFTRIPGPKSNVSANPATTRSGMLSSGSSKRIQNAHPVTNGQKFAGVKGLSKIPRTVPSITKVDLADKSSVSRTVTKQAGKHLDNSVSETRPPSKMNQRGSGANKASEALPPSRMHQTGSGANKAPEPCFPPSRMHQTGSGASKASEACLPQGISDTGKKRQQTLFQTTKSSGLRMPSPSIGFFSQAKASSSHSQVQKSSIPCKPSESNIPKPRKLGTISVNDARSKLVKGAAKNSTKDLSLLDAKSEPILQIGNKKMACVEVECDSLSFEKMSKQAEVENILEDAVLKLKVQEELNENENNFSTENIVFPTHEKEFLTKSHTHEQLEIVANHVLDDKLFDVSSNGDQSLYQEPQLTHFPIMPRNSNNVSNTVHNAVQDEDDQIKGTTSDILTFKGSLVLPAEHETSFKDGRYYGEFKEYNNVKTALLNSSLDDFGKEDPEGSKQGTPGKNTYQVNCGAGEFGKYGGDAQVQNEIFSINCSETTQSNLEGASQELQGEQLKTPNPSRGRETGSEKGNISDMNSSQPVQVTTIFSKGSPEKSILEIDGTSECESKVDEIKDSELPVDGQSAFIPRNPMDEQYENVIDSKAIHDGTQEFELDRLSDDCITDSAAAFGANVSPERRPFPESNVKNLYSTPQLNPMVKAGCDCERNDLSIDNSSTNSELQIRDDNFSTNALIHCEIQCDVLGNIEKQASQYTYPEINETSCEDETLVPNHGPYLIHQSESSEVSADLIPNIKDPIHSGAENSSGLLLHSLLAQSVGEFDHTYRKIEQSHEEDAQTQSFNENPVADHCSNEHFLAVTNEQFLLADDNNRNEDSHLSEFQKPNTVVSVDCQYINNRLPLDSDCIPTNITSSAEIKEQNLVEGAIQGCGFWSNEHSASDNHIRDSPENKDGNHDVDERVEIVQIDGADKGSSDILPIVEIQLNENVISAEFDSSTEMSEDPLPIVEIQPMENVISAEFDSCTKVSEVPLHIVEIQPMENVISAEFDSCSEVSEVPLPIVEIQPNENIISAEFYSCTDVNEDPSPIVDIQHNENVISAEVDSSTEVSEDPSPIVEIQHNENVITAEFDSSAELSEDPSPIAEIQLNENVISAEFDSSTEVNGNPSPIAEIQLNENVISTEVNDDPSPIVEIQHTENIVCVEFESSPEVREDPSPIVEIQLNDPSPIVEIQHTENVVCVEFESSPEVSEDPSPIVEIQLNDPSPIVEIQHTENVVCVEFESSPEVREDPSPIVEIQLNDPSPIVEIQHTENVCVEFDSSSEVSEDPSPIAEIQLNENVISAEFDSCTEVSEVPLPIVEIQPNDIENVISAEFVSSTEVNDDPSSIVEIQLNENVISAEFDSSTEVNDDPPPIKVQLNENVISAEFDSSIEVSEDWKSEEHVAEDIGNNKSPNTDMLCQPKGNINSPEDNSKIIHLEKATTKSKHEVPIVKPPPNVAPFTEEWLAAIEAAGEEILTMKSGAVQNSPPDKAPPEPSPWSPVKKNQAIGPFDCTKVTKHNIQNSDPS